MQADAATIIDPQTSHPTIRSIIIKNSIVFIIRKLLVLITFIVNYKINGINLDIFILQVYILLLDR